jgi:hypothetical protein
MTRRPVRHESDLPDHDFILEMPEGGALAGASCHIRHYVDRAAHLVIVGALGDGRIHPVANAVAIARMLTETVIPPGETFTYVAYSPPPPTSGESAFREVRFRLDGPSVRPSQAVLASRRAWRLDAQPVSFGAVQAMAARPVLTFPYGLYTRAVAEAMNGQPAARMYEVLVEADLMCPLHGATPDGEYCRRWYACAPPQVRRRRSWRPPYRPRGGAAGGVYVGFAGDRWTRIELDRGGRRSPVPVFGLEAPEVTWGYAGSGPAEAATAILADYLGFVPRPDLRRRFVTDVISRLPREGFTLPVHDLDRWLDEAMRETPRGLVVLASPASVEAFCGVAAGMAAWISAALMARGFDVYDPSDHPLLHAEPKGRRLAGMLHSSLLTALEVASMVVVPYDGSGLTMAIEQAAALTYVCEEASVPAVLAYTEAPRERLRRFEQYGIEPVPVSHGLPRDVTGVVEAVDRVCAAYECLHHPSTA